jgi:MOSC domain-containing protein YiiM
MNEGSRRGTVVGVYVAAEVGLPPAAVEEAKLVAGRGIVGDRYYTGTGTFSPAAMDADHQLTLIEAEEIDACNAAVGRSHAHGDLRRNIVTRGIELNALVGVEFRVGGARARGMRLCEPCQHLAQKLGAEILPAMVHRAGLRAEILKDGAVRPGDGIEAD